MKAREETEVMFRVKMGYRAHTALADGIFLALVGCTVLSWIFSLVRFVRRELA